jgi:hypothetical protein
MRIIGPKSHTNIRVSGKGKCADSNHHDKPNDFYQRTVLFKICFELAATILKQLITGSSETELFPIGERLLACYEESQIYKYHREIMALIPIT